MQSPIKGAAIGILGGEGFLGSNLCRYFSKLGKVDSITRENYPLFARHTYDLLINANGNSRRYWADQNALEDFEASTSSVYKSLFAFKFDTYVYLSSSDVYFDHTNPSTTQEDQMVLSKRNPYGFNKSLSEEIVRNYAPEHLILRMSALIGEGLKKGPLYDILQKHPLFVTSDSRIQFISADAVGEVIESLLAEKYVNQTFNVGGRGSVEIKALAALTGQTFEIAENAQKQEYEMNVTKLTELYPLKTSEEYIKEYLHAKS